MCGLKHLLLVRSLPFLGVVCMYTGDHQCHLSATISSDFSLTHPGQLTCLFIKCLCVHGRRRPQRPEIQDPLGALGEAAGSWEWHSELLRSVQQALLTNEHLSSYHMTFLPWAPKNVPAIYLPGFFPTFPEYSKDLAHCSWPARTKGHVFLQYCKKNH